MLGSFRATLENSSKEELLVNTVSEVKDRIMILVFIFSRFGYFHLVDWEKEMKCMWRQPQFVSFPCALVLPWHTVVVVKWDKTCTKKSGLLTPV